MNFITTLIIIWEVNIKMFDNLFSLREKEIFETLNKLKESLNKNPKIVAKKI